MIMIPKPQTLNSKLHFATVFVISCRLRVSLQWGVLAWVYEVPTFCDCLTGCDGGEFGHLATLAQGFSNCNTCQLEFDEEACRVLDRTILNPQSVTATPWATACESLHM